MSFALDFRKKLQDQQQEALRARRANEGFVSLPVEPATDTSGNRRRVFWALVIAGAILAVFNSGGLVQYSYDMAGTPVGRKLVTVSETWHGMMRETPAARVMERIRGSVALARESSWRDLTLGWRPVPARQAPGIGAPPNVVPAKGGGEPAAPAAPAEPPAPQIAKPEAPVMRASVEPGR